MIFTLKGNEGANAIQSAIDLGYRLIDSAYNYENEGTVGEAVRRTSAKKWGLIRSIGVCNFLPDHLERLEKETGVLPSVNQIELHPYFNQEHQRKWHKEHNIATESWSPFTRGLKDMQIDALQSVAFHHNKTIPQVILRWHYQLGAISIPKSSSPVRQLENISIFDFSLDETEMSMINALTSPEGRIANQDPAVYEEF